MTKLESEFGKFIEKQPAILSALANTTSLNLETPWNFLVYIFELNYLALFETNDGGLFRKIHEMERGLEKPLPPDTALVAMMQSAHALRKPESMQNEIEGEGERCEVQAVAAIPLLISGQRKMLLICKQLTMPKEQVVRGYVFNSYELQRYLAVIKNFVRVAEQQNQIQGHKKKILLGKGVAIASGVFGSLQALLAIRDLFGNFGPPEILRGLGTIAFLIFAVIVAIRLSQADEPFQLL
ncbi:MAG: hypothetical protein ACREOO_07125 [bacterium]